MEIRYFWITDQVKKVNLNSMWHPGKKNLEDYLSKHCIGVHRKKVCPWYICISNFGTMC